MHNLWLCNHIQIKLMKQLVLNQEIIEIKNFALENNIESKMLIMHTVLHEAKEIDSRIINTAFKDFKCFSF